LDSTVHIATGLRAGCPLYYFLQDVQTSSEAYPASYSLGTGILSVGKMARSETDHSSPSRAKVKNEWSPFSVMAPSLHGTEVS
jgi:hypothetical protein